MLFDLSKKQEVKIEFIAKDGEAFSHSKVISAGFLSFLEKINTNLGKKLKVNKDMEVDINLAEFLEDQEDNQIRVIKEFMGERYSDYLKAIEGVEDYANNSIYKAIIEETDKLTKEINNTKEGLGK